MTAMPMVPFPIVAMLAHELRNPLAPIAGIVQLLKRGNLDPEASAWAQQVLDRQVRSIERLVNDLLDVSRITCNKINLLRERIDLATVMERAAGVLRLALDAGDKQILFEFPTISLALFVDSVRIEQILDNLIHNAVKFTGPHGRIWITATAGTGGAEVLISVRDNGDGIDRDTLPHIFDLFAQGDTPQANAGLGIGLALVRQLVELHGGTVEGLSEGAGKGSEFRVHLPLQTAES